MSRPIRLGFRDPDQYEGFQVLCDELFGHDVTEPTKFVHSYDEGYKAEARFLRAWRGHTCAWVAKVEPGTAHEDQHEHADCKVTLANNHIVVTVVRVDVKASQHALDEFKLKRPELEHKVVFVIADKRANCRTIRLRTLDAIEEFLRNYHPEILRRLPDRPKA